MLSNLSHAKLVWIPLVCFIPNYYFLLHFGKLLAYVAALCETSVYRLLSVHGR